VHFASPRGVPDDDPDVMQRLALGAQGGIKKVKSRLRHEEAEEAAQRLVEGTPGDMPVIALNLSLLPDEAVADRDAIVRRAYRTALNIHRRNRGPHEPFIAVLPHPQDAHPTHRETTERARRIFAELAAETGTEIQLLYYLAPWAGDYNTYVHSPTNVAPKTATPDEAQAALAMGMAKRGLAYLTPELTAGFGSRSPSPEEMGGAFAERFRRSWVSEYGRGWRALLPSGRPAAALAAFGVLGGFALAVATSSTTSWLSAGLGANLLDVWLVESFFGVLWLLNAQGRAPFRESIVDAPEIAVSNAIEEAVRASRQGSVHNSI
jgi:hypothetical protein